MIIVLKPEASEREVDHIIDRLRELGLKSQLTTGVQTRGQKVFEKTVTSAMSEQIQP